MKKLLLIVAAALMSFSANAQDGVKFDVHAGMNMSSLSTSKETLELMDMDNGDTKMKMGFNMGVGVTFPINDIFAVKSGLDFSMKGGKIEESSQDEDSWYEDIYTTKAYYLQIPVLASFGYDISDKIRIEANVGPYIAFGVGGKLENEYTEKWQGDVESWSEKWDLFGDKGMDWDDEDNPIGDAGIKRLDLGLSLGAGVVLSQRYKIDLKYDLGLTNMMDKKVWSYDGFKGDMKTRNLSISVGYIF